MKYLYSYERHTQNLFRYEVIRETDSNIWIKIGIAETKVSKRTYKTGSGWYTSFYREETPELKAQYLEGLVNRKYQHKLDQLKNCTDKNVMKTILEIQIPDEKKES